MFTTDLQEGMSGPEVFNLQRVLEQFGYADFVPLGIFGPKTREAVKRFQRDHTITPALGFFGPITRKVMDGLLGTSRMDRLYYTAIKHLGKDASPRDVALDRLACVETFEMLVLEALGGYVGGKLLLNTHDLEEFMATSADFALTQEPQKGTIVIASTPAWNPALEMQAEDRTHRIGQSRPVHVYSYICTNTIEERIADILLEKRTLFADIVEEVTLRRLGRLDLPTLLRAVHPSLTPLR